MASIGYFLSRLHPAPLYDLFIDLSAPQCPANEIPKSNKVQPNDFKNMPTSSSRLTRAQKKTFPFNNMANPYWTLQTENLENY